MSATHQRLTRPRPATATASAFTPDRAARTNRRAAADQREAAGERDSVPRTVAEVLRSPGQPLDDGTRVLMEARFGHSFGSVGVWAAAAQRSGEALTIGPVDDGVEQEARGMAARLSEPPRMGRVAAGCDFSQVRIHADDLAAQSAEAIHARAYTVGRHIVFGTGEYQPASLSGRRLLAHELTHVVQQGSVPASGAQRLSRKPAPGSEPTSTGPTPSTALPTKPAAEPARPPNKLAWKWKDLAAYPLLVNIWKDVVLKRLTAKEREEMKLTGGEASAFFAWAYAIGLAGGGLGGAKLEGDSGKDWETTKNYAEALQSLTLSSDVMMDGLSRIAGLRLDKYLASDLFLLRLKSHAASSTALILLAQGIYSTVQAVKEPSEGPGELTEHQASKQFGLLKALVGAILKEQLKAPDFFDVGPLQLKTHPAFAAAPFAGGGVPSGLTAEGKTGVNQPGQELKFGLTLNLARLAGHKDAGDLAKYRGWQTSLWFTGEHLDPTSLMREAGKLPETKLKGGTLFGSAGHLVLREGGARLDGDRANAVTSWFVRGGYGYSGPEGSRLKRIGFTATYVDWTEFDPLAPGCQAGVPTAGRAAQVTPFAKLQFKASNPRHQFDVGAALSFVSGSQEPFGVSGLRGDFSYTYLGPQGSAGLPAFKLDLSGSLNRLDWWNPNSPLLWGVQAKASVDRFFGGAQVMGGAGTIPEQRAALLGGPAKARVPTAVIFTAGYAF